MKTRNGIVGYLFLIFSVIPSSYYLPILVLFLAYLIVLQRGMLPKRGLFGLAPLILMAVSGLLFLNSDLYSAFKDVWYLGKVLIISIVGILIGFSSIPNPRWLRTTAIFGSLAVSFAIVSFYLAVETGQEGARLFPLFGAVLIIPFFVWEAKGKGGQAHLFSWIVAFPILLAVTLSLSRTTILVLVVAWLGARGVFQSKSKLTVISLFLAAVIVIALPMLPQYDPHNITFLGKIQNSLNEMTFVSDNNNMEITSNWRGFEEFMAFQMWKNGSLGEQIFGHGLGTPIDIGLYYQLGEGMPMRFLPILHNGYFMVLVKYGVLGVAALLSYMTWPFWLPYDLNDPISVLTKRLGVTASIVMLITTLSITGPFNIMVLDSVTLLMGWSIGMQLQRLRIRRLRGGRGNSDQLLI